MAKPFKAENTKHEDSGLLIHEDVLGYIHRLSKKWI